MTAQTVAFLQLLTDVLQSVGLGIVLFRVLQLELRVAQLENPQ